MSDIQVTLGDEQPINISFETGDVIGSAQWGTIQGDLSDQTDLVAALAEKANTTDLADVALSGDYNDLQNIPAPIEPPVTSVNGKIGDVVLDANDVGADIAGSAATALANAKTYTDQEVTSLDGELAIVAKTGSYNDLSNKPTIPNITSKADITYVDAQDVSLQSNINSKVDKVTGKQLTTEDFTSAAKTKLDGIAAGAQVNTVTSVASKTGAVTLNKGDVGLGNVSNLAPADMPVSTAQAAADVTKVDKVATANQVYGTAAAGVQTTIPYSNPILANTLVFRDADGRFPVQTPVFSTQATPKSYVDDLVPIYGTGFPNGVVSATVGRIYIDTAATNGASSWIKKSGTGNTGWIVLEGDTGWRDITAYFANLEAVNPNDYGVYMTRNGNTIHLSIKAQLKGTWADGHTVMLPVGYRSGPGIGKKGNFFTEALQVAGVGRIQLQVSNIMSFVSGTVTAAGTRYYGSLSMPARPDEAWPTTLPGTAV